MASGFSRGIVPKQKRGERNQQENLDVVASHGRADLSQVFEQRRHHLRDPLPLEIGHLLQLLQL